MADPGAAGSRADKVAKVIPIGDGETVKARRKVPAPKKKVAPAPPPPDEAAELLDALAEEIADQTPADPPGDWDAKVAQTLAFLRRRITGDYVVDEFGYDAELSDKVLLAALRPLYKHWFRIETQGLE